MEFIRMDGLNVGVRNSQDYIIVSITSTMSAKMISQQHRPVRNYHKGWENEAQMSNIAYVRNHTPKRVSQHTILAPSLLIKNENHHFPETYINHQHVSPLGRNGQNQKSSNRGLQRQISQLKESYEKKIEKILAEHRLVVSHLEEDCKREAKEKIYWKNVSLDRLRKEEILKSAQISINSPTSSAGLANADLFRLQNQIQRLKKENCHLQNDIIRLTETAKETEEKLLRQIELRSTERKSVIKVSAEERDRNFLEIKNKSPLRFTPSHSPAKKPHNSSRSGSHHHHSSHSKNSSIRPQSNSGDCSKQLQKMKRLNFNLNKALETANEDLVRQRLKNTNMKYAQFA